MDLGQWLLLATRIVVIFFVLLIAVMLVVWLERKLVADFQTRIGPNRAGPFGILITLADGVKLFFKEGVIPTEADRPVYLVAPLISMLPAFLAFAVIPFGTHTNIASNRVPFHIADLNVGILWILAMTSLAVYGVVLAGWSSGSSYPLLGAIRSSAQMISYEVGMGLALVAVVMYTGTVNLGQIVAKQDHIWNVIPQFPAFLIYATASLAETNRPPFDLPEAETELVAGYHTEYSGMKFAMFFLAEYLHLITVSAIAVTLFLGGWRGPMFHVVPWLWPFLWFLLKLFVMLFVYIWIRATLPRFRYDRLMTFGWKRMIPAGLAWVLFTGAVVVLPDAYGRGTFLRWSIVAVVVIFVVTLVWPMLRPHQREEELA
jgi:NADH-quinone oxidoreductase subunit H